MSNKKAFTLVELLVVISIIGLLSTLAVVALNSARLKARDAKRISDIKQIQTGLEFYFSDLNAYPAGTKLTLGSLSAQCLDNTGFAATCSNPYMSLVPVNPIPGGADYIYSQLGGGTGYTIDFSFEGATGGLGAGPHQASQEGIK